MKILSLITICVAMTGCCLFRSDFRGTPTPVTSLKPQRVPIQIANDLMLHLLTKVFYNETKAYALYVELPSDRPVELDEVVRILTRKLYGEPHIRYVEKDSAAYCLTVRVDQSATVAVALFSLVSENGRVLWVHREPLKNRDDS